MSVEPLGGTRFAPLADMHPLWRTILVPHDFSPSANHAAAIARDEARHHGGRLVLVHVIELPSNVETAMVVPAQEGTPIGLREYAVSGATAHLDDLAERLAKDGVMVETVVRVGAPVDEILQAATDLGANIIVMGTHGRGGILRLVAGSVAERVVRASRVPVLTVRHPD